MLLYLGLTMLLLTLSRTSELLRKRFRMRPVLLSLVLCVMARLGETSATTKRLRRQSSFLPMVLVLSLISSFASTLWTSLNSTLSLTISVTRMRAVLLLSSCLRKLSLCSLMVTLVRLGLVLLLLNLTLCPVLLRMYLSLILVLPLLLFRRLTLFRLRLSFL